MSKGGAVLTLHKGINTVSGDVDQNIYTLYDQHLTDLYGKSQHN